MNAVRVVVLGLVIAVLPAAAFAQAGGSGQTAQAAQNAPAQTAPTQAAPAQAAPPKAGQPAADAKAPPAVKKPSDDEFIPSEELSPDEEVTFPVDI